jgi:hypothetical protein
VRHAWIYGGMCEIRPPVYITVLTILSYMQTIRSDQSTQSTSQYSQYSMFSYKAYHQIRQVHSHNILKQAFRSDQSILILSHMQTTRSGQSILTIHSHTGYQIRPIHSNNTFIHAEHQIRPVHPRTFIRPSHSVIHADHQTITVGSHNNRMYQTIRPVHPHIPLIPLDH